MKSAPRPADDARERRRGARAADRVVKACGHRVEPHAAEMAGRYGAETAVRREPLVCSRAAHMVVAGTERR